MKTNVTFAGVSRLAFLTIILIGSLFLTSSGREDALQNIRASGKITVLTRNNAHCYYVYRGEPMGFEYDLAKAFSDYLHVDLEVVTPTWEGLIPGLEKGEGDFVAASMSITKSRLKRVDFSDAYLPVQQYIILHKNDHAKTIDDLAGKTICVRKGTTYEELLKDLKLGTRPKGGESKRSADKLGTRPKGGESKRSADKPGTRPKGGESKRSVDKLGTRPKGGESKRSVDKPGTRPKGGESKRSADKPKGLKIKIKLYDDMPTEELIRMVAEKEIEATVADSHIALLNRRYYPDARIAFPLGKPSNLGWAVKKGEKRLLKEINSFFARIKEDGTFDRIYERYFANVESFDYVDLKRYYKRLETRLPKYRDTIQKAAEKYGFDWRLIAAMIYQESHFNPRARSYTGVRGLMQVTLDTAKEVGIESRLDPEQSILGGVKYLKKSYDKFEGVPEPDRLLMALASYNVGYRHVQDAQKIAKELDYDPNSWAALKEALPLLCHRRYYKKSRAGYCRGREAVRYVDRIITYYDILKRDAIS